MLLFARGSVPTAERALTLLSQKALDNRGSDGISNDP